MEIPITRHQKIERLEAEKRRLEDRRGLSRSVARAPCRRNVPASGEPHSRRPFLTTEYVVDETVTLLLVRHSHGAAVDFLDTIERSEALRLEWIGPERFYAACALFRKYADKEWSSTDCVSFGTMRELRVRDAFTTDHHFKQAGFVPLLK